MSSSKEFPTALTQSSVLNQLTQENYRGHLSILFYLLALHRKKVRNGPKLCFGYYLGAGRGEIGGAHLEELVPMECGVGLFSWGSEDYSVGMSRYPRV